MILNHKVAGAYLLSENSAEYSAAMWGLCALNELLHPEAEMVKEATEFWGRQMINGAKAIRNGSFGN